MRWIVMGAALSLGALAFGPAQAEWVKLTSDAEITAALSDRILVYDAYTVQSFETTGETLHVTDRAATGRWEARGGQYCSAWPPGDSWTCYDLAVDGNKVQFTGADLSTSIGTYVE